MPWPEPAREKVKGQEKEDNQTGKGKEKGTGEGKAKGRGRGKGRGKGKSLEKGKGADQVEGESKGQGAELDELSQENRWKHPDGVPTEKPEVGGYPDSAAPNQSARRAVADKDGGYFLGPRGYTKRLKTGVRAPMDALPEDKRGRRPGSLPAKARSGMASDRTQSLPAGQRSPDQAAGRGRAPRQRRNRESEDENRTPLEELELQVGNFLDGRVKRVNQYGIFLDVGAQCDAKLYYPRMKRNSGFAFKKGDLLEGLRLDWVDPNLQRIQVSHPETLEDPAGPVQKPSRPAEAEHFRKGSIVNGYVCGKTNYGVLLQIGTTGLMARMRVERTLKKQFMLGDEVVGMRVEEVDEAKQCLVVSLDDPELSVTTEELMPVPPKPKASMARKKSGLSPVAVPRDAKSQRTPHQLSAGDYVDGVVTKAGSSGVFVDLGQGITGRLALASSLLQEFRKGDQVKGMRIERLGPRSNEAFCTMEEPRLEDQAEALPQRPRWGRPVGPAATGSPGQSPRQSTALQARYRPNSPGRSARPARSPSQRARPGDGPWAPPRPVEPLEQLRVGAIVDGVVTRIGPTGVFVDFGAECEGRLEVSREDAKKFQVDDQVEGMVIEALTLRPREVRLGVHYELGEDPIEELPTARAAAPRYAKAGRRSRMQ